MKSPAWRRYLRFWGSDVDADVSDEFQFHLETEIEELVARGMTPDDARRDALRRFGDVAYYREYCRSADARRRARQQRGDVLDVLRQDVRYALRSLLRQPGFTAIAVLTLALGIGSNTAIFSVVNGVLLSPLSYREPDRLVMLWETLKDMPQIMVSYPDYLDWRARTRSFDDIAIYNSYDRFDLTGSGDPERIHGGLASANLFPLLGIKPATGRLLVPSDDRPGAARVVVLTDGLWRRRFGADPRVIGRPIMLDGNSYTIVGVLPETFRLAGSELWIPLGLFTNTPRFVRNNHPGLIAMGRLKPGVTVAQMRADLGNVARQIEQEHPTEGQGVGAGGAPLIQVAVGDIKPALLMLSGAVVLVLLVACANVANLLLGRAAARQKEFGLRVAIGAGRGRLVRQLLTESVVLALIGGLFGVALAWAGVELLVALHPSNVPRLTEIRLSAPVLAFAAGISIVTGLLFGVVPAFQSAQSDPIASLKESGRGAAGSRARMRTRATLTIAEVALALVLLVGAGLLLRSFVTLLRVDTGVDPRGVTAGLVQLPAARYPDPARRRAVFDKLLTRARALPGVSDAALTSDLAVTSSWQTTITREGASGRGLSPLLHAALVTPSYFGAMRIRVLRGREFAESDHDGAPAVVVVSDAAATRLFGTSDVIGKRIKIGDVSSTGPWLAIVGVVADVKNEGLKGASRGTLYFPVGQSEVPGLWLVVRSSADVNLIAPLLRHELAAIDPQLPLSAVQTLNQTIDASVAQPRFSMLMLGVFAAVALVLAAVGLYGVISFGVAQRSREIGVRIALGAQRGQILGMIVRQAMVLTIIGLAAGGFGAIAGGRVIADQLFGVQPTDPLVFGAVAALLVLVSLAASIVPALRATRIDPVDAMRGE